MQVRALTGGPVAIEDGDLRKDGSKDDKQAEEEQLLVGGPI